MKLTANLFCRVCAMAGAFVIITPASAAEPKFRAQVIDKEVAIGYGLAIGDVDGDKKPDILLADKKQFVWYKNGDWKRRLIAENLTERDNVAIAARDLDGDGKVEIAVGAQWNPGQTSDRAQSGAVFYLQRPDDLSKPWNPIRLFHDPTVHRMAWVKNPDGKFQLVVLPLHGRDNKNNQGANGVRVMAYDMPKDVRDQWPTRTLLDSMHAAHNFDVFEYDGAQGGQANTTMLIAGLEGVKPIMHQDGDWKLRPEYDLTTAMGVGAGEVRFGVNPGQGMFLATIEPMHGTHLVYYNLTSDGAQPIVLDDNLADGHTIGIADLLGLGRPQIVVGWRKPNRDKKVGIKMFVPLNETNTLWTSYVIDDNVMACEDLKLADLNGDGKPEIIAAGRATKNAIIYWNESK
ncbi:MAG: FG-GAP repeat domain-containing protein [Planctomycetota bacterium]|jgi:hypothetical protein